MISMDQSMARKYGNGSPIQRLIRTCSIHLFLASLYDSVVGKQRRSLKCLMELGALVESVTASIAMPNPQILLSRRWSRLNPCTRARVLVHVCKKGVDYPKRRLKASYPRLIGSQWFFSLSRITTGDGAIWTRQAGNTCPPWASDVTSCKHTLWILLSYGGQSRQRPRTASAIGFEHRISIRSFDNERPEINSKIRYDLHGYPIVR